MSPPSDSPTSPSITQCTTAPAIKTLDLSAQAIEPLMAFGEEQRSSYLNKAPFPHIALDNLFADDLLEAVRQDVIGLQQPSADPHAIGPTARRLLLDLCSARFCLFLEALSGIEGLIPDPYFEGSGAHALASGHKLAMPASADWHPRLKLNRRLGLLVYLNPDWNEQWGGALELWDSGSLDQRAIIAPSFNKTVIFSTDERAQYGHPSPLACPEEVMARSLHLYYYSSGRPMAAYAPTPQIQPVSAPYLETFEPQLRSRRKSSLSPKSVAKSLQKSMPKALINLYRAGKRSLRG